MVGTEWLAKLLRRVQSSRSLLDVIVSHFLFILCLGRDEKEFCHLYINFCRNISLAFIESMHAKVALLIGSLFGLASVVLV